MGSLSEAPFMKKSNFTSFINHQLPVLYYARRDFVQVTIGKVLCVPQGCYQFMYEIALSFLPITISLQMSSISDFNIFPIAYSIMIFNLGGMVVI